MSSSESSLPRQVPRAASACRAVVPRRQAEDLVMVNFCYGANPCIDRSDGGRGLLIEYLPVFLFASVLHAAGSFYHEARRRASACVTARWTV